MIIDQLLDYRDDMKEWNKLEWYEKLQVQRPKLDLKYIEDEAEVFEFDYLYNASKMYDFELHKALVRYCKENGYREELAEVVYL